MNIKEIKEFKEYPSKSKELIKQCIEECIGEVSEVTGNQLLNDVQRWFNPKLTKEETDKLRTFLAIEYTEEIIKNNRRPNVSRWIYFKCYDISSYLYEDEKDFINIHNGIKTELDNIRFEVQIPKVSLEKSLNDFIAGKMPSVCYKNKDYERLYRIKLLKSTGSEEDYSKLIEDEIYESLAIQVECMLRVNKVLKSLVNSINVKKEYS